MRKIKQLKELCKSQAHGIRTWNREWREHQRSGKGWQDWKPSVKFADSVEYRHHHIAYCLLRGTPYEKIEPKVHPGNEPNFDRVDLIRALYAEPEVTDETSVCVGPA